VSMISAITNQGKIYWGKRRKNTWTCYVRRRNGLNVIFLILL
jgi:hypothetical protein